MSPFDESIGSRPGLPASRTRAPRSTPFAAAIFAFGTIAALMLTGFASAGKEEAGCQSLRACLAEIEPIASDEDQITLPEHALAERIQRHGRKAIAPLIRLLSDDDESVRALAAYTLWSIDGLEPRHVKPILKAALREGRSGSLAWILVRIDSPQAIDALVQILRADPFAFSPVGAVFAEALSYEELHARGALEWTAYDGLGARALSALAEILESTTEAEALQRAVIEILSSEDMPGEAHAALLTSIVSDARRSLALRRAAIVALPSVASKKSEAVRALRAIAVDSSSPLATDATVAVFLIEGPGPGTSYERAYAPLTRRSAKPLPSTTLTMGDYTEAGLTWSIAQLWRRGDEARDAAGPLIDLLTEAVSAEVRVQAAWTLGFLGDPAAGPALIRALHDHDFLLVAAAADSLGRLGPRQARSELAKVADQHWYPPIRVVAGRALAALDGQLSYPVLDPDDAQSVRSILEGSVFTVMALPTPTPAPCVDPAKDQTAPRREAYFSSESDPDRAAGLEFESAGAHLLQPGSERRRIIPAWGARGAGGWFVAEDRGEWGGELVFIPDDGRRYVVARRHFEDVHQLVDGRWVAVEGIMGGHHGGLIELRRETRGWVAYPWRRLPGAPARSWERPDASWQRPDGTLVVNTNRGSVVLQRDGRLEMASCTLGLPEPRRNEDD